MALIGLIIGIIFLGVAFWLIDAMNELEEYQLYIVWIIGFLITYILFI